MTPPNSKARRWLAAIFYNIGIMAVGIWLWSYANETVIPEWQNWKFDHPSPKPAEQQPRRVLPVNAVIGRLEIPRLGVRTMVREGATETTLLASLGHIPGTALPGERGNVGVAGHRDTFFRSLARIRKTDVLQFETSNGTFQYEVVSTTIVKPKDVGVLRPGAGPEITLVTCYPFGYIGNAPERFIVKARQLTESVKKIEPTPPPAPQPREPQQQPKLIEVSRPRIASSRIASFSLIKGHTHIVAPGILVGASDIDPEHDKATVWIWVKANGKTIWKRDHHARDPIVFYNDETGSKYQLTVNTILDGILSASVLLPATESASNTR
jgi:sortase A